MSKSNYIATIGIECHVQLKTKTKLFAAISNDARSAEPNTLISHICVGMPGALPVLNKKAVELASKAAFALGTKPQKYSKFDRKHYFYPDLPKGYQISQFDEPIILGGHVDIVVDGKIKKIDITRAHMEEDAGKSTHPTGKDYSLVDLNRAGTPLLEIVSEPQMHSSAEAKAYAKELYLLMKYADVSDVDLYHGNMRFDVNVSVSKDPNKLGTRSETKNLNSFRSVEKSVDYEIQRQIELLDKGKKIVQETRGWDDAKQKTFSQRTKEDAHDYRYSPDPDIPPIVLDDAYIEKVEKSMPDLPPQIRGKLQAQGFDASTVETILEYPSLIRLLQECQELGAQQGILKRIANWLVNVIIGEELVNNPTIDLQGSLETTPTVLFAPNLVRLSQLVENSTLSSSAAKTILSSYWTDLVDENINPQIKKMGQVSDTSELEEVVSKVLAENTQAAEDVKNGELKAVGFLVGQVMKASQGTANPGIVQTIIKKQLGV